MGWRIIPIGLVLWSITAVSGEDKIATSPQPRKVEPEKKIFATVNGEAIYLQTFLAHLQRAKQKKYYHGAVPEKELKPFSQKAADSLIERVLLIQAAREQKLKPDTKYVEQKLKKFEQRYAKRANWKQQRKKILPSLREYLRGDSLLRQLENKIKNIAEPTLGGKKIVTYYKNNPDQFTTPERLRVSLILLKVDPSSATTVWKAARDEAQRIFKKLKQGADFSQLARIHSADGSAKSGGDMGYLHAGMLAPAVQQILEKLKEKEISSPVTLLQGVAIFRVDERKPAQLNAFDKVKSRARNLYARTQKQRVWQEFIDDLRQKSKIETHEY